MDITDSLRSKYLDVYLDGGYKDSLMSYLNDIVGIDPIIEKIDMYLDIVCSVLNKNNLKKVGFSVHDIAAVRLNKADSSKLETITFYNLPFIDTASAWRSCRPGKVVNTIVKNIAPRDVEKFVQAFSAASLNTEEYNLYISGAEYDFEAAYSSLYQEDVEDSCLSNSCMNDQSMEYFYIKNNDVVNILILKNKNGKIVARGLVWITDEGLVLDRLYYAREKYRYFIEQKLSSLGISFYKDPNSGCDYNTVFLDIKNNRSVFKIFKHKLKYLESPYPYLDTFRYLSYENGMLHNCPTFHTDAILLDTNGESSDVYRCDVSGEYDICERITILPRDVSILERLAIYVYDADGAHSRKCIFDKDIVRSEFDGRYYLADYPNKIDFGVAKGEMYKLINDTTSVYSNLYGNRVNVIKIHYYTPKTGLVSGIAVSSDTETIIVDIGRCKTAIIVLKEHVDIVNEFLTETKGNIELHKNFLLNQKVSKFDTVR